MRRNAAAAAMLKVLAAAVLVRYNIVVHSPCPKTLNQGCHSHLTSYSQL